MAARRKALCGCGGLERAISESGDLLRAIELLAEADREVEALRGINAALEGENRRAWLMVRRLEAERGADGSDGDAGAAGGGVGAVDRGVA